MHVRKKNKAGMGGAGASYIKEEGTKTTAGGAREKGGGAARERSSSSSRRLECCRESGRRGEHRRGREGNTDVARRGRQPEGRPEGGGAKRGGGRKREEEGAVPPVGAGRTQSLCLVSVSCLKRMRCPLCAPLSLDASGSEAHHQRKQEKNTGLWGFAKMTVVSRLRVGGGGAGRWRRTDGRARNDDNSNRCRAGKQKNGWSRL